MPIDNTEELLAHTEITFADDMQMGLYVAFDEYDSICAAWYNGSKFWDGVDQNGCNIRILMKDIRSIGQNTSEARKRNLEDRLLVKKLSEPII